MKRKEPKKNGRPSKLTPEITERFLNAIKLGATYELACNYAGINYVTLLNWRERKEPAFVEFFKDVTRAEGAAAVQWLALLEKHSHADAKWAAWKLERRYAKDYGRTEKHEHANPDGSAIMAPVADALSKIYGPAIPDSK